MDSQRNDEVQELLERVKELEKDRDWATRQIQHLNHIQGRDSERVKELEEGADWTKGQIQHLHYIQGWNEEREDRLHFLYPGDE